MSAIRRLYEAALPAAAVLAMASFVLCLLPGRARRTCRLIGPEVVVLLATSRSLIAARRLAPDALLITAYAAFGALLSFYRGQDMNWDLLNYHFYSPYQLLADRFDRDILVAGMQSYFNPVFDVPYYLAARPWQVPPIAIGLSLGALHGLNLWLVHKLVALLLPGENAFLVFVAGATAAITGASGAAFYGEIGATMGDNLISVPILGALVLLLGNVPSDSGETPWRPRLSGLLVGLAMGGKLVAGIYAIGLAVVCMGGAGTIRQRAGRVVNFGIFGVLGWTMTGGYWAWLMFQHYGSPLFPFYNAVFQSPQMPMVNILDARFFPRNLAQTLFYPFFFVTEQNLSVELFFRDARLATGYLCVAVFCLVAFFRSRFTGEALHTPTDHRFAALVLFTSASYVVWLVMFSIYRYAVPLELIATVLVVACSMYVMRRFKASLGVMLVVSLCLVTTTRPLGWERVPWSPTPFGVNEAELQRYQNATILMWDMPSGYLVPHFPESATFLQLRSNWVATPDTLMWQRLEATARNANPDALFLLEDAPKSGALDEPAIPVQRPVLQGLGLSVELASCRFIASLAGTSRICALQRVQQ